MLYIFFELNLSKALDFQSFIVFKIIRFNNFVERKLICKRIYNENNTPEIVCIRLQYQVKNFSSFITNLFFIM